MSAPVPDTADWRHAVAATSAKMDEEQAKLLDELTA